MRGKLTEEILVIARKLLDIELTVIQLRLLPYLQHLVMNKQTIMPNTLTKREHQIIHDWAKLGWLSVDSNKLTITKQFWDAMNAILWLGYVHHDGA